jgi:16S rRNA (uracil1498-N3)-methyltransferase
MHRFYLPPGQCQETLLTLSEREAHHAIHVLRIRPRERVVVLNGAGDEFLCEVQASDGRKVTLKTLEKNAAPPLPCQLTLLQAVTKGRTMEVIVQKATELGAHRIIPVLSERTVTRLDEETLAAKAQKWEATAIEAIKQCGSAWLPRVESPVTPQAFLARREPFELTLLASLQSEARHPRQHFDSFLHQRQRLPKSVAVWIGPEGDYTPAEINAIGAAGALPMTLGQRVLRSETAAIYCLAVIHYELESARH